MEPDASSTPPAAWLNTPRPTPDVGLGSLGRALALALLACAALGGLLFAADAMRERSLRQQHGEQAVVVGTRLDPSGGHPTGVVEVRFAAPGGHGPARSFREEPAAFANFEPAGRPLTVWVHRPLLPLGAPERLLLEHQLATLGSPGGFVVAALVWLVCIPLAWMVYAELRRVRLMRRAPLAQGSILEVRQEYRRAGVFYAVRYAFRAASGETLEGSLTVREQLAPGAAAWIAHHAGRHALYGAQTASGPVVVSPLA